MESNTNAKSRWQDQGLIERHSIDMRQFIDFRLGTLPNGMRIVEAYNGSGLTFTLLPDRGLDLWTAHYNGIPLTWISPGSPHSPDFGQSWLRQFNGGLLTTCGLTHVGPPETDSETGELRDLHGLYTRLRAGDILIQGGWNDALYTLALTGTVQESRLFGEQLRLTRTYRLALGAPVIHIADTVTNLGDTPAPLMLLYHFNLGFPLIDDGVKLHIAHESVYPRDATARAELAFWPEYQAATPHFAEQVFFHHVKVAEDNWAMAAVLKNNFGLMLEWDTTHLPYFTQWKNTRQGIYVNGFEPGNCIPEGQNAARRHGRLVWLKPGDTHTFSCRVTVLDDPAQVEAMQANLRALQATGMPAVSCALDDYAT